MSSTFEIAIIGAGPGGLGAASRCAKLGITHVLFEKGEVGNKPTSTLFLLSKYYRQEEKLGEKKTAQKLNEFMEKFLQTEELTFIMDETDNILIKNFSHFYISRINEFRHAEHVLDIETEIIEEIDLNQTIKEYKHEFGEKILSKLSISKTPNGPFQRIVFAKLKLANKVFISFQLSFCAAAGVCLTFA